MPNRKRKEEIVPRRRDEAPIRPVVIVPGIMASELRDPNTDELVWPPKNVVNGSIVVDPQLVNRLTSYEYLLPRDFSSRGTGPGQISAIAYAELIDRLQREGWRFDNQKLYFFEYNWAARNRVSGDGLAAAINYVLSQPENHGIDKVDVVAHSMGGIVTRSALRFSSAKIRRAAFIASPHYGTPKAYAVLHPSLGLQLAESFFGGLAVQLGWLWNKAPTDPFTPAQKLQQLAKDLPAVYELLPDEFYFGTLDWLFTYHSSGNRAMTSWRKGYLERRTTRFADTRSRNLAEQAMNFKSSLSATMPPALAAHEIYYSASETTLGECVMWYNGGQAVNLPTRGDGTVTAVSARDKASNPNQFPGTHSGLPNSQPVLDHVVRFLKRPPA